MALGDDYIGLAELKTRLGVTDSVDDALFTAAVDAASRGVEHFCRRQFNKTTTASARTYRRLHESLVLVDDFHTDTDLVVATDDDDDGVFETTWASSDFELEPAGGVRDGVSGWPYWKIRAVDTRTFPPGKRRTVQVTAQWGWDEVPDQITQATYIIAEDLAKLRDTPFGVGGFSEFGRIRARENPHAAMQLKDYRRDAVRVA